MVILFSVPAQATPRLYVVVVVDQMRADYVENSTVPYTAGLKRLAAESLVFTDAHHTHAPTETGPGHAVVMTGRLPGATGIVGNEWYDRARREEVYCVADALHGIGPENLWAYTLGDALKAKDPRSKVVSISVKDRAAVLMGGKKADAALWFSRRTGEFTTSTYYERPDWLSRFNRSLAKPGGALADATTDYIREVVRTPEADRMLLDLALEAAKRFKLGRDEHPDILAVSFSATDYIGHRYGPDSAQMREQLRRLDETLGLLISGLEKIVGKGRFDLALTADHGVYPLPDVGKPTDSKRIIWDEFTDVLERTLQYDFPAAGKWVLSNQFPHIYLNREQAARLGIDWQTLRRQAARRFKALEGMAGSYLLDDLDPQDPFFATYRHSAAAAGRAGDVVLRQTPGTLVGDLEDRDDHGSPYEYDTHVPLLFWGPDYAAGRSTETARVADLAPTAAAALGLDFKPEPHSRALAVP